MNTNNENELIQEFQRTGDPKLGSLLADRYDYLVTTACRTLYMTWADHEDILQEGRIGLFKALPDASVANASLPSIRLIAINMPFSIRHFHSMSQSSKTMRKPVG